MEWTFDKTCFRRIYDYDKRRNKPVDSLLSNGHSELDAARELLSCIISLKNADYCSRTGRDLYAKCRVLYEQIKARLGDSEVNGYDHMEAFVKRFCNTSINSVERDAQSLLSHVIDAILASLVVPSKLKIHKNTHNPLLFQLDDSPEQYFACRLLQQQLRYIYGIKAANRNQVVSQLINVIRDTYPKVIIKADVEHFYESIDLSYIVDGLRRDGLLDKRSMRLIESIQESMNNSKGLPRGVGLSAYLAEYRMRGFDRQMRQLDDLIYYARYVDDVILVFPAEPPVDKTVIKAKMLKALGKRGDLSFHKDEPLQISWGSESNVVSFSYLGYSFSLEKKKMTVSIANSKVDKIKKRIDDVFTRFFIELELGVPISKRIHLLYWRVLCLTNSYYMTLLPASNMILGIKSSYSEISQDCDEVFEKLDEYLRNRIEQSRLPIGAKKALSTLSFKSGRLMNPVRLAPHILREVLKCWRYDDGKENIECHY